MKKKKLYPLSIRPCFAWFCIFFLLFSCKQIKSDFDDSQVFRYNESANISSLDPAFSKSQNNIWVCHQLFNGLVQLDDSLKIQPDIAHRWEISEEGTRYLFFLRNDVYFHNNSIFGSDSTRTVKAQDFVYSFSRLTAPKLASPGGWILQNTKYYKALNDSVFEIKLQKPFPAFLGLLSMKYASVVPEELSKYAEWDFRDHPIGTGPFQFKFWEENIKLVLRKNHLYFEKDTSGNKLPYLEAVAISFLPDKQSGFLAFIQGKLDFISGLDPSYKDEILTPLGELQPNYKNRIKMITGPYLNTEYLGFRLDAKQPVNNDLNIRKALNYGFDRKKMIAYLRNNMGIPATSGIIPQGLPGFNQQEGYDYQPQKAKEFIKAYKDKTGDNTPKITLSTNATYIDIAEFLQREWQKIGIDVSIDLNPPATLRQAIATGKVSFFRASWIADYPDAENYLSLFYSKNFAPNGPNYTHFSNPKFDELYERSLKETEIEKRERMYQQMDSIIISEAPIISLFYDKATRFTQMNIDGLGINPLNLLSLKKVKKN